MTMEETIAVRDAYIKLAMCDNAKSLINTIINEHIRDNRSINDKKELYQKVYERCLVKANCSISCFVDSINGELL